MTRPDVTMRATDAALGVVPPVTEAVLKAFVGPRLRTRSPMGEYLTMQTRARTPSRHPIFLPSA